MAMFSTDAPGIIEHFNGSLAYSPADIKWVPSAPMFAVLGGFARGTGVINLFKLSPEATTSETQLHPALQIEKPSSIKCGTFGASPAADRHLAVGDYAGNVSLIDIDNPAKALFEAKAGKSIINAIDACGGLNIGGGAPEIVTGGSDGCVKVWDPRVPDPVVSLEPAASESARDCWTVAFGNSHNDADRCLVAGYDNGDVKLFDLRANAMRWEANVGNGVVCAEFDRKDIEMNKLVVTMLESKFRVYDMRTQHPTDGFASVDEKAHKATVWQCRHLPQNRDIFATTGGNGGINLYKYHYPDSRVVKDEDGKRRGVAGTVEILNARIVSSQPIVGFDWSPDKEGLACCVALDQTARVYIVTKLGKY